MIRNFGGKILVTHDKAKYEYFIEERFEAGIKLEGWEVKAIRAKQLAFAGSHVIFKDGKVYVIGMKIDPLTTTSSHVRVEPDRTRELLLNKDEIKTIVGKIEQRGWTMVPICIYLKHGLVKMEVALARGKKLHDKKDTIKERDQERELKRDLKTI